MEQNELDLATGAETRKVEITDTVGQDNAKKAPWKRIRENWQQLAIWARYLLPLFTLLTLFVMSFFYNVKVYTNGLENEISVLRLYFNTFKGMHDYLGGTTAAGRSWFYGIVTAGAVVGILVFLVALFLSCLAAYTAARAFLAGHESEESDRMKLIFKIAFPNRIWLFVSNLLIIVPFLYPNFFALVSGNFLAIGGSVIFVLLNRPLIVGTVGLVLTLVLALMISKHERRKKMNMFLLNRMQKTEQEETKKREESA